MSVEPNHLAAFFTPHSVAIIGASEKGLYQAGILKDLIGFGFSGAIYPVNPQHQQVFGLTCYAGIDQVPGKVDLAIVVVNRNLVLSIVAQCIAAGVKAVLIISAGFAESDEQGRRLQQELVSLIQHSGIAVLGPNCAGYADIPTKLTATRLPCAACPGGVSFLSQSGALMMALYGVFVDHAIGLNKIISVGNQVDINLGSGFSFLAADPSTRVIGAFVEGIQDGAAFVEGMRQALHAGKPLVLVKSGRTRRGQQAAATHTAAVAGSDFVFQSICRQFGAHLAEDIRPMIDLLRVQEAFGERLTNCARWMVVTQSGGMGSLTADYLEWEKIEPAGISDQLQLALQQVQHLAGVEQWVNPADVRGPSLRGTATPHTLRPFFEDKSSDLLLLLLARTLVQEQDHETARAILQVARDYQKPVAVVWVGQRISQQQPQQASADQLLQQGGIPVFFQTSDAVRALSAARSYWLYRQSYLQHTPLPGGGQ
jgi:acyl-CoA synthetase (NDP forming)